MLASNIEVLDCDKRLLPPTLIVTALLAVTDVLLSHSWSLFILYLEDFDPEASKDVPSNEDLLGRTLAVFLRRKR